MARAPMLQREHRAQRRSVATTSTASWAGIGRSGRDSIRAILRRPKLDYGTEFGRLHLAPQLGPSPARWASAPAA